MVKLQQGTVFYSEICDEFGENPKPHPIIIVNKTEDIPTREHVVGVVASHTATLRPDWDNWLVRVPHVPGGPARGCFNRDTAAVCDWPVKIRKDSIREEDLSHFIHPKYMVPIVEKVTEYLKLKKEGKLPPPIKK